ncbi:hypothetical protein F5Y03DRAFT_104562 [Xylaria venustula]|nr:hypothetical protein F5Y03DRAFT_104562 [Xylaria venustula]
MTTRLSGVTHGHSPYGRQNANHHDGALPPHPLHRVTNISALNGDGGSVSSDIDPSFLYPPPRPLSRGGHHPRRLNSAIWLGPYPRRARPSHIAVENLVNTGRSWLLPPGPAEGNPIIADPRAEHRPVAWQPPSETPSNWDQLYHGEHVSSYSIAGGRSPMDCAIRIDRRYDSRSPATNSDAGRSTPERGHRERDDESLPDLTAHWDPFWPRRSGGGSPRSPLRDENRDTPTHEEVEAATEEEEGGFVRQVDRDAALEENIYGAVDHLCHTL